MRNLFLTIVLSLFMGGVFAHHGHSSQSRKSDLTVKMWDNSTFSISLDHEHFTRTRNFSLKNITPGNHYVKIIKKKRQHNGHGIFVRSVVYEGNVNIPSRRNVHMKVDGRNRLSFKFFKKPNRHSHHSSGYGSQYGSYNGGNSSCGSTNTYGDGFYGNNHNDDFYGHNNGGHYSMVMGNQQFNQLLRVVKRESFDDAKVNIAKQALAMNHLSVNQITILMDQLTFDNAKLDFSKAAYNKTVDKENYFLVSSKFTFSRSANKLNDYIAQQS